MFKKLSLLKSEEMDQYLPKLLYMDPTESGSVFLEPYFAKKNTLTNLLTTVRLRPNIILKSLLGLLISFSDPHKFSCGSGSRITKMSIWIRIQTPKFLFGSGSKGGKNERKQIIPTNFQRYFSK